MPYAILRFQKRKAGGVAACERHNERKKEAYKSNPDIDMERSKNNYHLVKPPRYTYKKEINRMVAEAGCRTRKDSVMMVETLITASPEFMNSLPPEEQKAYFTMALDFISERVGEKNILSAVVHMDERTPHMHLCFVPITPDNKLSAKSILGNQKSLSEWQTAYHKRMSSRWNQLERGQSSMETKRKHVPTWLYKLGGRLDKQYEEIVSALSDINAFNAGKKRDKALELIAAWLPDVEKFSKEISKQSAYIDSLKEQIGQESDYAGRMRDEKYEQELKAKDLYPFPDNPFHVVEDETLSELAESIKEFGIVTPIITRPKEDGNGYEVIAGQRRVRASELAGINTVPAFVLPLDRDRAIITLVDSNLQRENILPSERAFAYKMKSEAMKRQGFRTDLTSSQVVTKLRTDDKVAQGFGVGRMTVQRFIRLTELIPPILQMVDEGKIALTPAVELSFLKKDEQENLFATMESEEATPSLSQAQRMKQLSQSGRLDMDTIFAIMTEEKGNQKETLKINTSKLKKYFPKNTTPKQMEETIIKLLERELQRKRNRDSR